MDFTIPFSVFSDLHLIPYPDHQPYRFWLMEFTND
jgi:hypothetical protein